jgi:hypothetical protein
LIATGNVGVVSVGGGPVLVEIEGKESLGSRR